MSENTEEYDVFPKPDAPRSDWECFKWFFNEPTLLVEYYKNLSIENRYKQSLYVYTKFIIPSVVLTFILFCVVESLKLNPFNLSDFWVFNPKHYPSFYTDKYMNDWNNIKSFQELLIYNVHSSYIYLILYLAIIAVIFVVFIHLLEFFSIIDIAFISIMFFVKDSSFFIFCLAHLQSILSKNFLLKVDFYFNRSIFTFLGISSAIYVLLSIFFFHSMFSNWGIYFTFFFIFIVTGVTDSFYNLYYELFGKLSLKNNIYINSETILIDFPNSTLVNLSKKDPFLAIKFINFLHKYRPFQKRLAIELEYAVASSIWKNTTKISSEIFEKYDLTISRLDKHKKYTPSIEWEDSLSKIADNLKNAELQHNLGARLDFYQKCEIDINKFEQINLKEIFEGRKYFFSTIEHWQKLIKEQVEIVKEELALTEPITHNPYSKGTALSPNRDNQNLFLERTDLKDEISLKILTSESMPMFLIQGQRRVGKTTLLNFLPQILDPSRFEVVYQDLQGFGSSRTVSEWINDLWHRINEQLKLNEEVPIFEKDSDPLAAWENFKAYLSGLHRLGYKIILALDEYDAALPKIFQRNVEQSEDLLGRIRSFSQHQNDVIFMFIGSAFFSDLKNPNWGNYFVHVSNFRVDYLSRNASLQLITTPTPAFNLKYEKGVPELIYDLTVGQPHLLHFICSELVDYANAKYRNPIAHSDLDYVLKEKLLQKAEQPFSVFWDEFCENNAMKKVVRAIACGKPFDKNSHFRMLEDHRYIVQQEDRSFKMRVPLFEEWVKMYGYWDED